MVEYKTKLDDIFHSLADPTRRDILRRLSPEEGGEQTITELAHGYDLTLAAVSKHIQVLEQARLVRKRRAGREQRVRLSPAGLGKADQYLERYRKLWEERLDRLGEFLKEDKQVKKNRKNK